MEKKTFNAKLSKLVYLLVPALILITVPFIITTSINIARMSASSEGYFILIDVTVIVLLTAILCLGLTCIFLARYTVKKHCLQIRIGAFFNRIELKHIVNLTYFRANNKLALFYKHKHDVKQIMINIDDKQFDTFVLAIKEGNKDVSYVIQSEEE